jgi:hypothetical protein
MITIYNEPPILVAPGNEEIKFNINQIPHFSSEEIEAQTVQRPALQSVRCQCKIKTLLYNNALKKIPLPFYNILRRLSENIP